MGKYNNLDEWKRVRNWSFMSRPKRKLEIKNAIKKIKRKGKSDPKRWKHYLECKQKLKQDWEQFRSMEQGQNQDELWNQQKQLIHRRVLLGREWADMTDQLLNERKLELLESELEIIKQGA